MLDNRARRRAGAATALGRAVAHPAMKNGAARSATSTAIVGAPFFTTHTVRTAIPDHVVRDPRTRAADPWPDPGALPVGLAIIAARAATIAALAALAGRHPARDRQPAAAGRDVRGRQPEGRRGDGMNDQVDQPPAIQIKRLSFTG